MQSLRRQQHMDTPLASWLDALTVASPLALRRALAQKLAGRHYRGTLTYVGPVQPLALAGWLVLAGTLLWVLLLDSS